MKYYQKWRACGRKAGAESYCGEISPLTNKNGGELAFILPEGVKSERIFLMLESENGEDNSYELIFKRTEK